MRLTPLHSMLWPGLRSTAALADIHPARTTRIYNTASIAIASIAAFAGLTLNLPHQLAASVAGTLAPVGVPAMRREHAHGATFRLRIHLGDAQIIALLATLLSVAFYIWYAQQDLTLAYGDSISHMLIARRVLVGRHPGLAQLGTVWPPFTHILMLPLVWNDDLYRSGFAGAFPSMVAYVLSAIYTLRLGKLAFGSRTAGWVAALALMLNPNVLYMQSTPMTEMGLICAAVIAIYYAVSWAHDARTSDLVKCAAATAAGTLIRYDGWALALALAAIIGYIAWRRGRWVYTESHLLLYGSLAFAGCAAWFIYNRVIFGNWLEFFDGPYSSKAQQSTTGAAVHVPTIGDPLASLNTYGFATIDTAG
ncbi:MAG: ArnT family glycosyltransferase, partial [Ktedonobacterales bacterium]